MLSAEPLTLMDAAADDAKAYLRIHGSDEDALVGRLMRASAELAERFTGQALLARGFVQQLPASTAWRRLAIGPVQAIVGVEAVAADGQATALSTSAYAVDIDASGEGWVRLTASGEERQIRVRFEAGLALEWSGLPEPLRQGAVRLAAHLYTHRDDADGAGPPAAVTALWRPYRRPRLG